MTDLVVRRLLIDLETPFDRHWCGGDAFRSAFFNALSMSFPVGEQFFIDALRAGFKELPAEKQSAFDAEVKAFIGQEATHRRIHALFNEHLERQGLVNEWAPRNLRRVRRLEKLAPYHGLALTAAHEHLTALFADWMLSHPEWTDGDEPRFQMMWMWHCSEEVEHKSTAFDMYQALGGNNKWRLIWMRRVTRIFLRDLVRQTMNNLKRDGTLWKWSTWKSAGHFLFGKRGLVRHAYKSWRDYKRADFHPSQLESPLSHRWLADNAQSYTMVGA